MESESAGAQVFESLLLLLLRRSSVAVNLEPQPAQRGRALDLQLPNHARHLAQKPSPSQQLVRTFKAPRRHATPPQPNPTSELEPGPRSAKHGPIGDLALACEEGSRPAPHRLQHLHPRLQSPTRARAAAGGSASAAPLGRLHGEHFAALAAALGPVCSIKPTTNHRSE